ncbi:MAG: hypothetical protein DWP94_05660 [Flavobacterium sp.]|nr:MAG: hypothetical protein DWP94_05660 [Flavobacterium sp.]
MLFRLIINNANVVQIGQV